MKKYEEYIKKNKLGEVYNNKSFKDITTIKIGGKIMMLYYLLQILFGCQIEMHYL